jgi:hypothetical protein
MMPGRKSKRKAWEFLAAKHLPNFFFVFFRWTESEV